MIDDFQQLEGIRMPARRAEIVLMVGQTGELGAEIGSTRESGSLPAAGRRGGVDFQQLEGVRLPARRAEIVPMVGLGSPSCRTLD